MPTVSVLRATTTDVRFAELQQLCQEADDKSSLAFGMAGMLLVHVLHGRVREASELASEYMTLVESIGEPTLTVLLAFVALPIKMETGPIADALRWAQQCIDLGEGDPLLEHMVAGAFAVRGSARWAQGNSRWKDDFAKAVAMARGTDPMVQGYVVSVTYSAIPAGVMLADDEAMANLDEALHVAERSSDDLALGLARLSMGFALLYRDSAAERERGAAVLAQVREMILAKRFYASELPIVEAWIAREMSATGDRDGALPMIRKAVETLFDTGQWGYLSATAGVLVDTLLARGEKGDIGEADRVIQRLAIGPGEGLCTAKSGCRVTRIGGAGPRSRRFVTASWPSGTATWRHRSASRVIWRWPRRCLRNGARKVKRRSRSLAGRVCCVGHG